MRHLRPGLGSGQLLWWVWRGCRAGS